MTGKKVIKYVVDGKEFKKCTKCDVGYPADIFHFYREHGRLTARCKWCRIEDSKAHQKKTHRYKVKPKTGREEPLTAFSMNHWLSELDKYKGRECDCLKENGTCVFINCRWHLFEFYDKKLISKANDDDLAHYLANMSFSCMWEVIGDLEENNRNPREFLLTQEEVACNLGLSKQRIDQIEKGALRKLAKDFPDFVKILEPAQSFNIYIPPRYMQAER